MKKIICWILGHRDEFVVDTINKCMFDKCLRCDRMAGYLIRRPPTWVFVPRPDKLDRMEGS